MPTPLPPGSPKIPLRCPQCHKNFAVVAGHAQTPACPACKVPLADLISGYRIERKLGAGGMGDVFLATQTSLNRPVALKILPLALTRDPNYVKRFLVEARSAGRVRHENIVAGVDAGEDGGRPYFVMEYVEGETLLEVIKREGPLPENRVQEIARQVASGLKAAYEEGLIHRDIKPANVMITRDGTAKICDFGLARDLKSDIKLTQEGHVLTSPGYASPEQCKGEKALDHRTDMYSLGVTLFEAVTKKLPFEGDSAGALLVKHVTQQPPAPKSVNPNVSSGMNQLILRLLRKQPTGRFETYDDLLEAIEGLGQEKSERVAKRGGTAKVPRTRKKSPLPLVLGGASVGVLLLIVLVVALSGGSSSTNDPPPADPSGAAPEAPSAAQRDLDTIHALGQDLAGKPSLVSERRRRVVALESKYRGTPHEAAFTQARLGFESRLEEAATTVARTFLAEAERRLEAKKDAAALVELEKVPQGFGGTVAFQHVSGKAKEIREKIEGLYTTEVRAIDREIAQGKLADARTRMGVLMGRVTYIGETGQTYLRPEYEARLTGLSRRLSEEELLARKAETEKPPARPRPAQTANPGPASKPSPAPPPTPKPAPRPSAAPPPDPKPAPAPAAAVPATPSRLPVPEREDLEKATRTLREIFADDFASDSPATMLQLAKKLVTEARKPEQEVTARYALLKEAADLAASIGEVPPALVALKELIRLYDVDPVEMTGDVLTATERKATEPYQRRALAEAHLKLAEQAVDQDDFNAARRSASKASSLARRARAKELSERASDLSKDISAMRRAFVSVQRSLETLKRDPDDPKSNLAVGRYECFLRGRWRKGLRHLARSGSSDLAEAAKLDLARPADAEARLNVADAWWDASSRESEPSKTGVRGRAAGWYQLALSEATGIEAIRLKRRITEVPEDKVSVPDMSSARKPGGSSKGTSVRATGLIGYWKFDETSGTTAADSSGNGITARADRPVSWASGRVGGGVQMMDTRNTFSTEKTASALGIAGAAPRTLAAWVHTRLFDGGGIFDLGDYNPGENFAIKTNVTPNSWRAQFWGGAYDLDFSIPSQDRWVHLALTYDGSVARVYADGREVAQRRITINTSDTGPLKLGTWRNISFKGTLDDVRLYNRALSASEIARVMGGGAPAPVARPWRSLFDGTSLGELKVNGAWQISERALTRLPGEKSAVQSREEFDDVEVRIRFRVARPNCFFSIRQGTAGSYEVAFNPGHQSSLEGKTNELVLTALGTSVTATLNGGSVTVANTGSPRRGRIQFNERAGGTGLRILSIDVRAPGR